MSGVNRLKKAQLTERGLRGKALVDALDKEMVQTDPVGSDTEREGITPKISHGKHSQK